MAEKELTLQLSDPQLKTRLEKECKEAIARDGEWAKIRFWLEGFWDVRDMEVHLHGKGMLAGVISFSHRGAHATSYASHVLMMLGRTKMTERAGIFRMS